MCFMLCFDVHFSLKKNSRFYLEKDLCSRNGSICKYKQWRWNILLMNTHSRKIEIIITISAQMDLIECLIIILNTVSFINFHIYLTNQLCLPLAKMKFRIKFIYNVLFLDCIFMIQLIRCVIRPADFFISCKILKKKKKNIDK